MARDDRSDTGNETDIRRQSKMTAETFWSHDLYAPSGSPMAERTEIAKKFIDLFEESLRRKHCRVASGVEIECNAVPLKADTVGNGFTTHTIIDYIHQELNRLQEIGRPIDEKLTKEAQSKLADLPMYRANNIYRAYQDSRALEIVTRPADSKRTIAYVTAIKRLLLEATAKFHDLTDKPRSASGRQWMERFELSLDKLGDPATAYRLGEHINLSLHNTASTEPFDLIGLGTHNRTHGNIAKLLSYMLTHHTAPDALLLFNAPHSFQRFRARSQHRMSSANGADPAAETMPSMANIVQKDRGKKYSSKEAARVEWCIPDASSDIHLSMLVALAGVYALVPHIQREMNTKYIPDFISDDQMYRIANQVNAEHYADWFFPDTPQATTEKFRQESLTLQMMRKLVATEVPPNERAEYHALIARFEALAMQTQMACIQKTGFTR